jgi:endonuclease/exonuclease/phosphatase family metal-dependent hydrolase
MKNFTVISVVFISTLLLFFSCVDKQPMSPAANETSGIESAELLKGGRGQLTVMNWNIYVGANVDIILGAQNPQEIPFLVAQAYQELLATQFEEERAPTIAQFIKRHKPHIVGLQEVSLIQRFSTFPPAPGSFLEQFDFLDILLNELAAEGLDYRLADSIQNADVFVPMYAGGPPTNPLLHTVRLLDADAILVRGDVAFSNVIKDGYADSLEIADLGIKIPRGYVSIEAKVGQKSYRFATTHLEAFSEFIRFPQAQELAATFANETLPVIMVGDFNTLNPTPPVPFNDITYQFLTSEPVGYQDIWLHNLYGNQGDGFTSPHDSGLMNPFPDLYQRIDLIFVRNHGGPAGQNPIGPVQAEVIGDELQERTPSGLWPSDHAGLVAKLHLSSPAL